MLHTGCSHANSPDNLATVQHSFPNREQLNWSGCMPRSQVRSNLGPDLKQTCKGGWVPRQNLLKMYTNHASFQCLATDFVAFATQVSARTTHPLNLRPRPFGLVEARDLPETRIEFHSIKTFHLFLLFVLKTRFLANFPQSVRCKAITRTVFV